MTEEEIRKAGIRDKIYVITWSKKVVNQYHHLETVEANIGIMAHEIKVFIKIFDSLVKMGLPFFCREKVGMLSHKEYHDQLIRCGLDHSKFIYMQQSLSSNTIVNNLED